MKLFTIGFTKKTARDFFSRLRAADISSLVDIRLNNVSQLAGFAKRDDLDFFTRELCGVPYLHELRLAPLAEDLELHRAGKLEWKEFEKRFLDLLRSRAVETALDATAFDRAVLLCSEDKASRCHRRLSAEYLAGFWAAEVIHL